MEVWQVAAWIVFFAGSVIAGVVGIVAAWRVFGDDGSDRDLAARICRDLACHGEGDVTLDDHGGKPWTSNAGTRLDPERANGDWP